MNAGSQSFSGRRFPNRTTSASHKHHTNFSISKQYAQYESGRFQVSAVVIQHSRACSADTIFPGLSGIAQSVNLSIVTLPFGVTSDYRISFSHSDPILIHRNGISRQLPARRGIF